VKANRKKNTCVMKRKWAFVYANLGGTADLTSHPSLLLGWMGGFFILIGGELNEKNSFYWRRCNG